MCLPALLSAYAASSPKRLLGQLELAVIRARVRSGMANASDNARMRQILQRTKNRKALVCKKTRNLNELRVSCLWCARRDLNPHVRSGH